MTVVDSTPAGRTDAPIHEIVQELRQLQAFRVIAMRQQYRIRNSALATIRVNAGWRWSDDAPSREEQNKRAQRILDHCWHDKPLKDPADLQIAERVSMLMLQMARASAPFEETRTELERKMRAQARRLPVHEWVKQATGLNADTLAVIVGECGDLANYPTWKHVAKRMGLAPYNGRMGKTWKIYGGLSAEQWSEFGYVGRRRAIMHTIGEAQIRNRTPYRDICDAKKEAELARTDEGAPKSQGHAHARGLVLMERYMLRDLWRAWRDVAG